MNTKKQRQISLDLVRIIAMLAVILVHVCGIEIDSLGPSDVNWRILVLQRALVTWEVPIFVMISGRFFLDPERNITFSKIWKSIRRLVIAFIVWTIIYQLYYILSGAYSDLNWKGIISQAIIGPYHFWYLFMLILVYAVTPFLRKITEDKRLMEYFIVLFLLFQFLTEYGVNLSFVGTTISEILVKAKFYFPLGYTGYYILGYYLYKYGVPKRFEIPLYIAGIIILACSAYANLTRAIQEGYEEAWYTRYLLPNIIIESAAVYSFAIHRLSKIRFSERTIRWIATLSEYSFGVYLIHSLVIEFIAHLGLKPTMLNPLVMVPLLSALTYAISHVAVVCLKKVPYIGKMIT